MIVVKFCTLSIHEATSKERSDLPTVLLREKGAVGASDETPGYPKVPMEGEPKKAGTLFGQILKSSSCCPWGEILIQH